MSSPFNFFRKTPYNLETKLQLWTTVINDMHDSFCGCCKPFVHLLSVIFPEDHKDHTLSISEIIKREQLDSLCLFGGQEEENSGGATGGPTTEERDITEDLKREEDLTEEAIEELIAAADTAEER